MTVGLEYDVNGDGGHMGTCCFCPDERKSVGPFTKIVHVISETLGKKLAVTVDKNLECDDCNCELSKLEQKYMGIGVEFMYRPYVASIPLGKGARRGHEASTSFYDPVGGVYKWSLRDGHLVLKIVRPPEFNEAEKTVTLTVHREFDGRIISRQIAKWGLEIAASQLGIDRVRQKDFDAAREFARFDKGEFRPFLWTTTPPLPKDETAALTVIETSVGVFFFYALLGVAYVANLTSLEPPRAELVAEIANRIAASMPALPVDLPEGVVVRRETKTVTKKFILEKKARRVEAAAYHLSFGYTEAIDEPLPTAEEIIARATPELAALIRSRFAVTPSIDDLVALTRDKFADKGLRKELGTILSNPAPRSKQPDAGQPEDQPAARTT